MWYWVLGGVGVFLLILCSAVFGIVKTCKSKSSRNIYNNDKVLFLLGGKERMRGEGGKEKKEKKKERREREGGSSLLG